MHIAGNTLCGSQGRLCLLLGHVEGADEHCGLPVDDIEMLIVHPPYLRFEFLDFGIHPERCKENGQKSKGS